MLRLLILVLTTGALAAADRVVYRCDFDAHAPENPLWSESGWAGGTADIRVVDSGDPQGGRHAVCDITSFGQIAFSGFAIAADRWYRAELTASARGTRDTTIAVRQQHAPWTTYGSSDAQIFESPRQIVVVFKASEDCNPARVQLVLRGTTSITLDDVVVTELVQAPPEESGDALSALQPYVVEPGNLVPNGSFELGRDGWFTRGPATFAQVDDAHHGRSVMRLRRGGAAWSHWLALSLRHDAEIWCWAKPVGGWAALKLEFGDYVNFRGGRLGRSQDAVHLDPAKGWQRVAFRWRPPVPKGQIAPTVDLHPGFMLEGDENAEALIDLAGARIVVDGETWTDAPLAACEWGIAVDAPYAVATRGEPVVATVRCSSDRARATLRLMDEDGREARAVAVPLRDGRGETTFTDLPCGYWRLRVEPDAGASPYAAGETFVAIVPTMPEVPVARWRFGTHVRDLPGFRLACWKLGWRWNRLHDVGSYVKWPNVQPSADAFQLDLDALQRMSSDRGQQLLGNLDGVPAWAPRTDGVSGDTGPKEMVDATFPLWSDYCRRVAQASAGVVDDWEVTNEPNLSGMTPEHYLRVLESAAAGIRAGNPRARIVGLGGATPEACPWMLRAIELGAGRHCDAVSFHAYGSGTAAASGPEHLAGAVAAVRSALVAAGTPDVAIYDTESGFIPRSAHTKFRLPYGDADPRTLAATMPKAIAAVATAGLDRWFYYAAFDTTHPGEYAAFASTELGDVIKQPFQPMAVAISLIEGRRALGRQTAPADVVHLAFAGERDVVHLLWAVRGNVRVAIPAGATGITSMWGRDRPVMAHLDLDQDPLYCIVPSP